MNCMHGWGKGSVSGSGGTLSLLSVALLLPLSLSVSPAMRCMENCRSLCLFFTSHSKRFSFPLRVSLSLSVYLYCVDYSIMRIAAKEL